MTGIIEEIEKLCSDIKYEYNMMLECEKERDKYVIDAKRTDDHDMHEDSLHHAEIKTRMCEKHRKLMSGKAVELSRVLAYLEERLTDRGVR